MKSQPLAGSEEKLSSSEVDASKPPVVSGFSDIKSDAGIIDRKGIIIQENILLAPYTTFKVGGPARFFCEVKNETELKEAVKLAKEREWKIFVLGGGSNVVISDAGFSGLVIRVINNQCRLRGNVMYCDAGVDLARAVRMAIDNSLEGFEWASGIPGAVGGAIRGNACAYGGCIADLVISVKILDLDDLKFKEFAPNDCLFSYRSSIFKEKENFAILGTVLKLEPGNREELEKESLEIIRKRREKHPQAPSAGSFFQNPLVHDKSLIERFENDLGTKCRGSKIPAGWLIDEVDLRGEKVGQVMVSNEHANFIINLGGGRAEEIVMLASLIKQKVRSELGVQLVEEVKYVGF